MRKNLYINESTNIVQKYRGVGIWKIDTEYSRPWVLRGPPGRLCGVLRRTQDLLNQSIGNIRLFREDIAQNIKTDVMPYLSDLIVHSCIVSLAIAFLSLLQAILALSPRFFSEMKITTIALNFLIAYSEVAIIVGCTFIISQRLLKLCNVGPVIRWFLKRRWRQYVYFFV
jgi:hypothetical protein